MHTIYARLHTGLNHASLLCSHPLCRPLSYTADALERITRLCFTTMLMCYAVIPKITELHSRYLDAYRVHLTISPTTRLSAAPVDQVQPWVMHNGKLTDVGEAYGHTVYLGPPLGLPAISIPVGLDTAGLPLGIQLQARPGMDVARRHQVLHASSCMRSKRGKELCQHMPYKQHMLHQFPCHCLE